ncbi:MAG: Crp/Fnr family transcriptional regulator [Bacteroidales bacterium]|nr:Crp/Fnr family transcriptional regulator [Bacteroidales bacterium]
MEFNKTLTCAHCSKESPVFCFLNERQIDHIERNRIEVVFNPGETIMKGGTPKTHVMSFYKGLAKVSLEGKGGRSYILGFIRPQTFFSGPGFFFDEKHRLTITAIEECKLCLIEKDVFYEMMEENFKMAFAFMENSNRFILNLIHKMETFLIKHHHGRVADALLHLSKDIYHKNPFTMTISRKDLADLTALPKESVSRILHEFIKDQIITMENNEVHILKEDTLKHISHKG